MKPLIDKQTATRLNNIPPESKNKVVAAAAKALAIIAARKGQRSPAPGKPSDPNGKADPA